MKTRDWIAITFTLVISTIGCGHADSGEPATSPGYKPESSTITVRTSDEGKRAEIRMGAEPFQGLADTPCFAFTGAVAVLRHETRNGRSRDVINLSLCRGELTTIAMSHDGKPTLVCADGAQGPCETIWFSSREPSYLSQPASLGGVKAWLLTPKDARRFVSFLDEFAVAASKNENVSVREETFDVVLRKEGDVIHMDPDDEKFFSSGYLGEYPHWENVEIPAVLVNVAQLRSLVVSMLAEIGTSVDSPPAAAEKVEKLQQAYASRIHQQRNKAEADRIAENKRRFAKAIKDKKAKLNARAGLGPTVPVRNYGNPTFLGENEAKVPPANIFDPLSVERERRR